MPNYYINWNKRRVKNKINLNIIYNDKEIGIQENSTLEEKYINKKYLSFDKNNPTSTMLYSNKIAIIIWIDDPIITLIESEEAYKMYKRYFNAFWNQVKGL